MILTSIERRLAKIETARRPPKGLFYVVWGRLPEEIEATIEQARHAGVLIDGDPVVRCAWPIGPALPLARWARDEMGAFSHIEFGALMGEVDRLRDDWTSQIRAEMHRRGESELPILDPDQDDRRLYDDPANKLHDVALFAAILPVPLGTERASLTEDRVARVVRYMGIVGVRSAIRGCDAAMVRAVESADRTTRH